MNKKFFGIKLSTILTAFACLIVAFLVWMTVEYVNIDDAKSALSIGAPFRVFRG